jgi:hypothetical protein
MEDEEKERKEEEGKQKKQKMGRRSIRRIPSSWQGNKSPD